MARECIAVALSPTANFELGKTYAIHIGAASNLQTVIRRRLPNHTEAVDVILPSPQICSMEKFVPYWIILQNGGQVSVGIGRVPGINCIGTLDDGMYNALRSGVDAVKYVGLGNSALGRKARDLKVRNVRVMPVPDAFAAFGGIPLTPYDPLLAIGGKDDDAKDAELWADYQNECEKAKKRAIKFDIEYKQPPPNAFLKWSEARRLRANPAKGFITGMDIMSAEEKEKARKRKERFEEEDRKNKKAMGVNDDMEGADGNGNDADVDVDADADADADMETDEQQRKREPLPFEQAWDNEDLVGDMRTDPPQSLYLVKNETNDGEGNGDRDDSSLMDDDGDGDDAAKVVPVPTKIHLFAIDWAAFKQIRTDDIMAFFRIYGPSYVEWLGELSCNVHFEDKYSAARALEALSRALPTEIPFSMQKAVDNDDAFDADVPVDGIKIEDEGDNNETMGEEAEANTIKTEANDETAGAEESKPISSTNLGSMGWRFCNYALRKMQSDKYGKRGTRSRCLFRVATSLDVLDKRPNTWPKPPPGFTTKRVLGPGSDFQIHSDRRGGGGGGKRRRHSGGDYHDDQWDRDRYDDEEEEPDTDEFGRSAVDQMDRGLSSSRAGFTVEQMEAERNAR